MPKSSVNASLSSYDDIFSTEEFSGGGKCLKPLS